MLVMVTQVKVAGRMSKASEAPELQSFRGLEVRIPDEHEAEAIRYVIVPKDVLAHYEHST